MLRLLTTSALAVLILAACSPVGRTPAPIDPLAAGEAAAPKAPEGFELSYSLESENYSVQCEIDPAILAFDPALAYRLWTNSKEQLEDLGASANEGREMADADAEISGEDSWFMAYTLAIRHEVTGTFDDIISVRDTVSTYSGGAHPNYFLAGGIYRRGQVEDLALSAFVNDQAAFNDLVVKGLADEKIARGAASAADSVAVEAELRELLVPSPDDIETYNGNFVFQPSTEPGKIGGLTVMFSPYDVGSYAEGAYSVTLPAATLTPILTPTWAPRFGGEPVAAEE